MNLSPVPREQVGQAFERPDATTLAVVNRALAVLLELARAGSRRCRAARSAQGALRARSPTLSATPGSLGLCSTLSTHAGISSLRSRPASGFEAHFARRQQTRPRGLHQKILAIGGGVLVMGAGLFFLLAPGPGLLIFLIGALLVAEESRTIARLMDGADLRLRRLAAWVLARWRRRSGRTR
jgi:hypothetical protein